MGDLKQQDLAVSMAEFFMDKWTVGLTGHYLTQNIPTASYIQTNADLGFLYTPKENLGFGLVVYNIFGEKGTIPKEFREKTSVAGAVNYIYRNFTSFRLDITSESVYEAGMEIYFNKFVIGRLGYSDDTVDERQLLTAGIGFNGPRFQINYAYQANTEKSGDYRHSIDLIIPF